MLKSQRRRTLIIAAAYVAAAAAAFAAIVKMPGYKTRILIIFAAAVVVSAVCLVLSKIYLRSAREVKERERISRIMHSLNAMAILWTDDFRHIEVNDELTKSIGYSAEDLLDIKTIQKVLPPDAFAPSLQAIVNNRDEEFAVTAKGGAKVNTIWNTSMMSIVQSKKRAVCLMLSIGTDISEIVRMRENLLKYSNELEEAENRYTLSMELSEIGVLLKQPERNNYYLSDQLRAMLGVGDRNITAEDLRMLFHPADAKIFDALSASLYSQSNSGSSTIHSSEFRIKAADGQYHWYQFRYKITPNADSKLASIGGAVIDITENKEKDTLIEKMAYIDEITQIFNRNKFMQIGQETFECVSGEGSEISYWVIVLDIDNFHLVNDTLGYESGNRLLSEFGKIVESSLTDGGFGARIGGDNFALMIRDSGDDELPVTVIKSIQEQLTVLSDKSFASQTVTCSAGYCKMSDGGSDFAQVLDHAEFSLSMSDGSKGDIIRYDHNIHDKIIEDAAIETELIKAIENDELALYYQPKIDLADGRLTGMEALIRWIKPDGTVVPPSQFIPVAENSLLITKISEFVLYEACRQNKEWQDKGYPPIAVSVNLTAVDFYQTDVKENIRRALDETGLAPEWLDVELTESLALKDIDHAIQQMKEIRELGVQLSMDDFGTGYSSLSYIQVLPITLLKLDRSFIMYLEEDEISREIVSAVIRIAKSKKIETIAEGIETVGQAEILKQSGCDLAQGYFFGKPMPADKFEKFMAEKAQDRLNRLQSLSAAK